MDITKLTLDEFLGKVIRSGSTTMTANELIDVYGYQTDCEYKVIIDYGEFQIVDLNVGGYDVGLCYNAKLIGLYKGTHLFIDYPANYSGPRGLSLPLILVAAQNRDLPVDRNLTAAGEKALTRAWLVANGLETSRWWPPPSA